MVNINPFACITSEDVQTLKLHRRLRMSTAINLNYDHVHVTFFPKIPLTILSHISSDPHGVKIYICSLDKFLRYFGYCVGQTKQIKIFHFFGYCKLNLNLIFAIAITSQ